MSKLTVVMYHYVREIKDSRYSDIKGLERSDFISQIDFLAENFNVVTMEQVIAAYNNGVELPPRPVLLTFDDGYAEHFSNVFPILEERGLQGSFFVPAKAVLEHKLLDVNKIHFILASVPEVYLLINALRHDLDRFKNHYELKPFEHYYREFALPSRYDNAEVIFVKRMLQHVLPEKLRNQLSSEYFERFVGISEAAFAKELYMSVAQLKQLSRNGMHIGCHGYDHYWWNKLEKSSLEKEIIRSKEFLASLGCSLENWTACYPYGSSDDSVVATLRDHGCALAFTTQVKVADVGKGEELLIPRLDTNDFPPRSYSFKQYEC